MKKKIFIQINNRFLKGVLLRSIDENAFDAVEILDDGDLGLKMEVYESSAGLFIVEITEAVIPLLKNELRLLERIKPRNKAPLPIMGIVSKDTADVVGFAVRHGIPDVLYLSFGRELYGARIKEKLAPYYHRLKSGGPGVEVLMPSLNALPDFPQELLADIEKDLMQAYTEEDYHSIILIDLNGYPVKACSEELVGAVRSVLRNSDKLYGMMGNYLCVSLPATGRAGAVRVAEKISGGLINKGIFTAEDDLVIRWETYMPNEEKMVFPVGLPGDEQSGKKVNTNIKEYLNVMTKPELELYQKRIRQYRKFF